MLTMIYEYETILFSGTTHEQVQCIHDESSSNHFQVDDGSNVSVTNTHVYYLVVSLNTSEENALNNQAMLESDYRSTPKELIT